MASWSRVLIFLWAFLFVLYWGGPQSSKSIPLQTLLQNATTEAETLGNMTWPVNASLYPAVADKLDNLADTAGHTKYPQFYRNITGFLKGRYSPFNLSAHSRPEPPGFNHTEAKLHRGTAFDFNRPGSLNIHLRANDSVLSDVKYLEGHARLTMESEGWWNGSPLVLDLQGVHFLENGSVLLIGVPEGVDSALHDIPNMMRTNVTFTKALSVVEGVNQQYMRDLEAQLKDDIHAEQEVFLDPVKVNCTFRVFIQLKPLSHHVTTRDILILEQELEDPQGLSTITPPPLLSTTYIYSPECGIFLEADGMKGLKLERYHEKTRSYAMYACLIAAAQLYLTLEQMEYTATHSALSKVSVVTIGTQSVLDAYLFLVHLTTGIVIQQLFLPFVTVSFFLFALFSIFEMRYLFTVSRAQRRDVEGGILGAIFSRFYVSLYVLFMCLFLFYQYATRFTSIIVVTGIIMHSFWVPQIYRNVKRNSRKAFQMKYVVGISVSRLAIPLYIYGCPHNVVNYDETSPTGLMLLAGYVAAQVGLLVVQDVFGPRLFVPEHVGHLGSVPTCHLEGDTLSDLAIST
ncbi:hypothetical protein HK104_001154 [Borealophlyctis nickersoniae]|nr:hypothetical protein HK104_001154 [Borealophlyctis nickersoniae]